MTQTHPIPVTAVFDIGKTNKKFFLFDEDYSVIQKQQTSIKQTFDEDGDPCENLDLLEYWIRNKIGDASDDPTINIQALNFSTYGASFAHLNKEGKRIAPLYNYLKPYPEDLFSKFYELYGGKEQFSLQTASPPMGMLNSGLQLFWLKYDKPDIFNSVNCSLHFPQYLSYLMTGKRLADLTSIGCHTALWNFENQEYHHWLRQEDCLRLLPAPSSVSKTYPADYENLQARVGPGIHDSSAALAPYLLTLDDPFLLISTGTWSITFNPFNEKPLTYRELQKDCLCYLDINGNQVKASRFFLGNEYMHQRKKIVDYFNGPEREGEVNIDASLLQMLITKNDPSRKLKLEQGYGSGPFPQDKPGNWRVGTFSNFKEAYHQLMLDLVAIQAASLKLAQGNSEVDKLIITGGFSQNNFFLKLLASFFPEKKVFTSSLPNASAVGAAMLINEIDHSADGKNNLKRLLGLKQHQPLKELKVGGYSWKNSVTS